MKLLTLLLLIVVAGPACGGELSAALLNRGFAVLALDARYHGDRAVYNDYLDAGTMVFEKGWGVRYANMLPQSVVDYRRVIDHLATRSDVDEVLRQRSFAAGGVHHACR